MYSCDVCGKDHWEPDGLRTIQVQDDTNKAIWGFVCCTEACADKVRDQWNQTILTDEPFRGEPLPDNGGYI
jgi:hypothetical protein